VTRVAVVDIGSNSTRLLVAEVAGGSLRELQRESIVTRLGEGVDATRRLGDEPQQRVFAALDAYADAIDRHGAELRTAVLTSAVRDAANGAEFTAVVRERYGLDARTLSGDDEARLTFLGATAARDRDDPTPLLVIDIGGGSTELVVGARGAVDFHVSTQVGVVRHTERHLHSDPPAGAELDALAADARGAIEAAVPAVIRERPGAAVAVAGTATSCAAIDLALDPYDPERVEGHVLSCGRLAELRDRLAAMPLAERRGVTGLDPARAPTIVAGVEVLLEVLSAFGLDRVEVSDRDILWGDALASTIAEQSQEK
jgi:exopolyphosphatase / guanosine-5'-triphosphate,3'-diphosphate pyrophosphatase